MTMDVKESLPAQVPTVVPVEHRWFGLDRRTIKPSLAVLAVALLLIYGWQGLNAAIPWDNPVKAGDVLDLGDGATAVPPVGWQLEAGSLVGGEPAGTSRATVATGGTTVELQVATFSGDARAFLDRVQQAEGNDPSTANGSRQTLTTQAGLVGVVQGSTSPSGDALEGAFKLAAGAGAAVDAAPALLVRVSAAPGQFERNRSAVTEMLRSITPVVTR